MTSSWKLRSLSRSLLLMLAVSCVACSREAPSATTPPAASPAPAAGQAEPAPPAAGSVAPTQNGTATFISERLNGRKTASGETYDGTAMVAAHASYPFGTVLRVTNPANGRVVEVKVVDRIPSGASPAKLDLSRAAAEKLDFIKQGETEVQFQVVPSGR